MRHNRLFAAGLAAALMLGAASPALADGKGKAKGKATAPGQTKQKPSKPTKAKKTSGVSGGGSVLGASFSILARTNHLSKGHFNYTTNDETYKLRCRDFSAAGVYSNTASTVTLTGAKCSLTTVVNQVATTQQVFINATFIDNGQPASATKDAAFFYLTTDLVNKVGGDLTGGNIKVRP